MTHLVLIASRCTACRICELACSYHHTAGFARCRSSIEVLKSEATGKVELRLHRTACDTHPGCDECAGEDLALCVAWCPEKAIVKGKA